MKGMPGVDSKTPISLDSLLAEMRAAGRVCPQPKHWQALWEVLPNKQRSGAGWLPPLPLILAAWNEATDAEKTERFRLHLAWADQHAALDEAIAFLLSLAPSDWYTQT
jgi:hypothetical protein